MAYPANVFRVLIASPGDVADEREIAVRTIQEWNDLNSAERQIVLLPLRWETHASPEYGTKPQVVINRQVADRCDLVIGIFWTRIGTATGNSESGTVEEIERAAQEGKPIMLYFSQSMQDPDKLDLEQLSRLRDFKRKTLPNSLIESYSSQIDFKDKLARQLEIRIRELLASAGNSNPDIASPVTDIRLRFAEAEGSSGSSERIVLKTQYFKLHKLDEVPDYIATVPAKTPPEKAKGDGLLFWRTTDERVNKDYYRQSLTYRTLQLFFVPVTFWLKNFGSIGARDIHIDLQISNATGGLTVISKSQLPTSKPSKQSGYGLLNSNHGHASDPTELISASGNFWTTQFEIPALQPQRQITMPAQFLIGAVESCVVTVGATIFADTLPEPVRQVLEIDLQVDFSEIDALTLLPSESDEE